MLFVVLAVAVFLCEVAGDEHCGRELGIVIVCVCVCVCLVLHLWVGISRVFCLARSCECV